MQSALETALASVLGHSARAIAAGRTDTGVHADEQVVSFSTSASIPAGGIREAVLPLLPSDIWIADAADAPQGFDARRDAQRRWYRYAVWLAEAPSAAWRGRCLPHPQPLDLDAMRQAAQCLLGCHDFRGYASPPEGRSTKRTIYIADWLDLAPLLLFEICADGFLTHMVRGIVGGLLWVGRGRWTAEQFAAPLITTDRRDAGPNAPPVGLTLTRIDY